MKISKKEEIKILRKQKQMLLSILDELENCYLFEESCEYDSDYELFLIREFIEGSMREYNKLEKKLENNCKKM